jgi:hypothetical protein
MQMNLVVIGDAMSNTRMDTKLLSASLFLQATKDIRRDCNPHAVGQ